jgi:hypothetical protein
MLTAVREGGGEEEVREFMDRMKKGMMNALMRKVVVLAPTVTAFYSLPFNYIPPSSLEYSRL